MAMVTLRFLGPPVLERDGVVRGIDTRKALALLAYLVEHQEPVARENLATLLWPTYDAQRAYANLRRTVWSVHKALGPAWLTTDQGTIGLRTGTDWTADTRQFRHLYTAWQRHAHGTQPGYPDCLACLATAIELVRGEFLAGFHVTDSVEFDDWQQLQVGTYQQRLSEALAYLVMGHQTMGEFSQALAYAQRWAVVEPLHQAAHYQVMLLAAWTGQPAAALRHYHALVRRLAEEARSTPTEAITHLYDAIKAGRTPIPPTPQEPGLPRVVATTSTLATDTLTEPAVAPPGPQALPTLVEREDILRQLHAALARARQGQRQTLFVSGEPGIGKTTVVETFLAQAGASEPLEIVRGHCVEHYGTHEAYSPVLEALGQICRSSQGETLVAILRQHAPTWLVQMPWLLSAADRDHLRYELQGTTRERMLRECATALEVWAAEQPLVLVLEDLHWCDYATLDLLALLARRHESARLLLLGTYRPGETMVQGHPLHMVTQELRRHGQGRDLPLAPLSEAAVTKYLTARCPGLRHPATLVPWLHQHTDGHPLFLVVMVQWLEEQNILKHEAGRWRLDEEIESVTVGVPEGLRPLLEQQLTRLPLETQRLLEVASAVGVEFAAAAVAAGLETSVDAVEACCDGLVQQHMLLPREICTWPDGTMTMRYAFTHALYQQMAYQRLGTGQRLRLHQRLGQRLEQAYTTQSDSIAAELAEHYSRSQQVEKAVHYWQRAASTAGRRAAYQEMVALLQCALQGLTALPDTLQRAAQELELLVTLGPILGITQGYAAPAAQQIYARAYALCQQLGNEPQLLPALWGLSAFYTMRSEYVMADAVGQYILDMLQSQLPPDHEMIIRTSLGFSTFYRGEFGQARAELEQAIACYPRCQPEAFITTYGADFAVLGHCHYAMLLWLLGYPEQARQHDQQALTRAQSLAYPSILLQTYPYAIRFRLARREHHAAQHLLDLESALAHTHAVRRRESLRTLFVAYLRAMAGGTVQELEVMTQSLETHQTTGILFLTTFYLALLAEAAGAVGQAKRGRVWVQEALTLVEKTGERYYEAELHRLAGELLVLESLSGQATAHLSDSVAEEAEACLQRALAVARQQQARWWELRAAISLARLWQQQGKRAEAHALLAPVYAWFTEGLATADLQEAQTLLAALA